MGNLLCAVLVWVLSVSNDKDLMMATTGQNMQSF